MYRSGRIDSRSGSTMLGARAAALDQPLASRRGDALTELPQQALRSPLDLAVALVRSGGFERRARLAPDAQQFLLRLDALAVAVAS